MAIVHVNDDNFEQEVLKSKTPVIVDFFAQWCNPCRMMGPIFEEVSDKVAGVKFAKLDVDEAQNTAGTYGVMSIPTLLVFDGGKVVDTMVGLQDEESLTEKANSLVK